MLMYTNICNKVILKSKETKEIKNKTSNVSSIYSRVTFIDNSYKYYNYHRYSSQVQFDCYITFLTIPFIILYNTLDAHFKGQNIS